MLSLAPSRAAAIRAWITRTFSGRALAGGVVLKLAALTLALAAGPSAAWTLLDTIGDLALVAGALALGFRLFVDAKQRFLWRVTRKLTVSYVFIGLIPAILIIVFFLVSGLILFFNLGAYMTQAKLDEVIDRTRFVAESAAISLQRAASPQEATEILARREAAIAARYPGASMAILAAGRPCGASSPGRLPDGPVYVGPWRHLPPPERVPAWIGCDGHAGLVTYAGPDGTHVAARAAIRPDGTDKVLVVDVPLDDSFARELRDEAGIELGLVAVVGDDNEVELPASVQPEPGVLAGPANISRTGSLTWVAQVDYADWETGAVETLIVSFGMNLRSIYERISVTSRREVEGFNFGEMLLILLATIGGLFLIIQAVAFSMGLALARSITGAVHELFEGTERVRRGDFAGRIAIRSQDQLGELSQSFNSMTSSIEDLLQEKAEKERLEQELRIARSIQMSLLPQGGFDVPGASVIAHCEPAREVGGDYYDFLPIDEHTIGILIADVSGKGTSAALYMAELKGIVLSLSQRHTSPRELLIEADRIISRHLDSRSFITVTYIVLDLQARTLRYARAGHCPLIYVPGAYAPLRAPQLLLPDGLVLGLQLDEGRTFARLLEEVTLPVGAGDLFLLYTDGMSEAMNPAGECFGDARLSEIVGAHADLPPDELRERILREIGAFADTAPQHDDMTMVLLRVEQVGATAVAAVPQ